MNKNTSDLQQELSGAACLDEVLQNNEQAFAVESLPQILTELLRTRNISKAELAKNAAMSEVYLHQVFSGRRNPSRNRLLCLCCSLQLTFEETQKLLRQCGHAALYPRNRRDAIVCYGLLHHLPVFTVNDHLFEHGEETLY